MVFVILEKSNWVVISGWVNGGGGSTFATAVDQLVARDESWSRDSQPCQDRDMIDALLTRVSTAIFARLGYLAFTTSFSLAVLEIDTTSTANAVCIPSLGGDSASFTKTEAASPCYEED